MIKYMLLFLAFFIYEATMAQLVAPNKGSLVKYDSLSVEMVFPKKNMNCFQFYLYDSKMVLISTSGITGKVGFAFDKTGTAILNPKLKSSNGIFEACFEDWKDFYYCVLKLNINGKEMEFMFLNSKMPKTNVQHQNTDGHSGHTH